MINLEEEDYYNGVWAFPFTIEEHNIEYPWNVMPECMYIEGMSFRDLIKEFKRTMKAKGKMYGQMDLFIKSIVGFWIVQGIGLVDLIDYRDFRIAHWNNYEIKASKVVWDKTKTEEILTCKYNTVRLTFARYLTRTTK